MNFCDVTATTVSAFSLAHFVFQLPCCCYSLAFFLCVVLIESVKLMLFTNSDNLSPHFAQDQANYLWCVQFFSGYQYSKYLHEQSQQQQQQQQQQRQQQPANTNTNNNNNEELPHVEFDIAPISITFEPGGRLFTVAVIHIFVTVNLLFLSLSVLLLQRIFDELSVCAVSTWTSVTSMECLCAS